MTSYGVKGDLGLERQFLHAHRLRFAHPVTGAEIDVESPLPDDLAAALERARARQVADCYKLASAQVDSPAVFRPFDPATSRGGGAVALCAVPPGPSVEHLNQPERG